MTTTTTCRDGEKHAGSGTSGGRGLFMTLAEAGSGKRTPDNTTNSIGGGAHPTDRQHHQKKSARVRTNRIESTHTKRHRRDAASTLRTLFIPHMAGWLSAPSYPLSLRSVHCVCTSPPHPPESSFHPAYIRTTYLHPHQCTLILFGYFGVLVGFFRSIFILFLISPAYVHHLSSHLTHRRVYDTLASDPTHFSIHTYLHSCIDPTWHTQTRTAPKADIESCDTRYEADTPARPPGYTHTDIGRAARLIYI